MANLQQQFREWPKTETLEPILNSPQEALLLAQIISPRLDLIEALRNYRRQTYIHLNLERSNTDPDPQYMMRLALRAHLFRVCIEEVSRIRAEELKF